MFLFENLQWHTVLMGLLVLCGLLLFNEITRRNKWIALFSFLILPIALSIFVWPNTAGKTSSVGTWFHWAKVYSVLIACVGFMLLRYFENLQKNKFLLTFPAIILSVNIMEAVVREFQCYGLNESVNGVFVIGGPWNILNGIAGIFNILAISGWLGIVISKDKYKDMIWNDQMWFWIIAYDLWNFGYVYNCVSDHSFYAGLILLLSCTIPAFFIRKGAWIQHRAHTLGAWMMFVMCFPAFVDTSSFAVKSTHNTTALMIIAVISIIANGALIIYHGYRIVKFKRNPLKDEVYSSKNHIDAKI